MRTGSSHPAAGPEKDEKARSETSRTASIFSEMSRSFLAGLIFPLLAGASSARGADIDALSPGQAVHGPSVSQEDLKGKVVWVEFWGFR